MIKGYYPYFKEDPADDDSWVRVSDTIVESPYQFTGLDSGTDYSGRIAMTAVDFAGNESPLSDVLPPGSAMTPALPVGDAPMSDVDKAAIDSIVAESMAESGQPGVLVSITGPRGSYAKAYGNTKTSGGRPLTLDDHVRIGSATKAFTAMAVLKAIDDELLSFDDTLASFAHPTIDITKVPNAEKITVRHLLSMRAGVYDYQADLVIQLAFLLNPNQTFSAAGAVQAIVNHNAPVFEPGTSYAYSNSNYVLLGLILEVVRGKSIKRILTEDIIAPLGMTETQWPSGSSIPEPAAGQTAANPELLGAAGALTSTIGDLTKWAQALRDHDLISAEMWDIWTSWFWDYDTGWANLRYQSEYIPLRYGYGLGAESIGSWQGHPGGFLVGSSGWGVVPFFDKDSGATIAVAENKATSSPVLAAQTRIFTRIASYLYPDSMFDASHPLPPPPAMDLGFDAVSEPFSGYQKATGSFAASSGADVFAVVSWDRPAAPSTVSYGGVAMTQLGSAFHNNNSAYGGVAMYRLAAAGTGAAKALLVDGASAWVSAYAVSYADVTSVGTPTFATGSGTALAQSITNTSGVTLQAFSAGAAGGPTFKLSGIVGAFVRAFQLGTNPLLWLNTAIKSGVIAATGAGSNFWASIACHIGVKENHIVKPAGASITTTRGTPVVVQDVANKVITPSPRTISITGGRPGGSAFFPSGASLTASGGTPSVAIDSTFTPFNEKNITRTDYPVPAGSAGAWVTLIGGGGGGGGGRIASSGSRGGGGGGGGGSKVFRTWIPIESMGSTYSVARGFGGPQAPGVDNANGLPGSDGGTSSFSSGTVTLTARGGKGGAGGTTGSTAALGGAGGIASASGASPTMANGTAGGNGGRSASPNAEPGVDNTAGAGAGGAGGPFRSTSVGNGASGGASTTSPGGASLTPGSNQLDGDPGPGGGTGARGGDFGGGGGGRYGGAANGAAGSGGDGYTLIEWV